MYGYDASPDFITPRYTRVKAKDKPEDLIDALECS